MNKLNDGSIPTNPCMVCVHKFKGRRGCAAFPGGIPEDIRFLRHDHREPYPNDNGTRFAAVEGERHPMAEIDESDVEELEDEITPDQEREQNELADKIQKELGVSRRVAEEMAAFELTGMGDAEGFEISSIDDWAKRYLSRKADGGHGDSRPG